MTGILAFLRSMAAGYRQLFMSLGRLLLAAAGLAAVSALIALPLTYLALEQTRLYTILLAALIGSLILLRLFQKGPGGVPRMFIRLKGLGILIVVLLLLYLGLGSLVRGGLLPGIAATLLALSLIGIAIRR